MSAISSKSSLAIAPKPDIYLSYTASDEAVALQTIQYLEARNVHCCTVPRNGNAKPEQTSFPESLQTCRILLLLFSGRANQCPVVQSEVDYAVHAGKIIIPFRLENISPTGTLETNLRRRYKLEAFASPLEVHLEELTKLLKPLKLKTPANPMATTPITGTLAAITSHLNQGDQLRRLPLSHEPTGPIQVFLDFQHPLITGHGCPFELKLENHSMEKVEQVAFVLDSWALDQTLTVELPEIPARGEIRQTIIMEPSQPGDVLLKFSLQWRTRGRQVGVLGFRPAHVHAIDPDWENEATRRAVPENFERLDVSLDYEVGIEEEERAHTRVPLVIPEIFLNRVQEGTVLQLVPVDSIPATPLSTIRLVARASFSLGRSREEADYLTWFWPRNEIHDTKTRRLSKKQCVLGLRDSRIYVSNQSVAGHTTFDGQEIISKEGVLLKKRGILNLSEIYFVDAVHFPASAPDGPVIENEDDWSGAAPGKPCDLRGCVRFVPVTPHVLPQNSTWIFSEATFGRSQKNPIILDFERLSEIQGRFYHHRGAFWMESFAPNSAVTVDDTVLKPGLVIPLANGQAVRFGEKAFRVSVAA